MKSINKSAGYNNEKRHPVKEEIKKQLISKLLFRCFGTLPSAINNDFSFPAYLFGVGQIFIISHEMKLDLN